jgi:hypothetical protein
MHLCEFRIINQMNVLNHKKLLINELRIENGQEIDLSRLRLRKKYSKKPATILLDDEVFGKDIFINSSTEFCIEILDGKLN